MFSSNRKLFLQPEPTAHSPHAGVQGAAGALVLACPDLPLAELCFLSAGGEGGMEDEKGGGKPHYRNGCSLDLGDL